MFGDASDGETRILILDGYREDKVFSRGATNADTRPIFSQETFEAFTIRPT
jgi:hypothetical protein